MKKKKFSYVGAKFIKPKKEKPEKKEIDEPKKRGRKKITDEKENIKPYFYGFQNQKNND